MSNGCRLAVVGHVPSQLVPCCWMIHVTPCPTLGFLLEVGKGGMCSPCPEVPQVLPCPVLGPALNCASLSLHSEAQGTRDFPVPAPPHARTYTEPCLHPKHGSMGIPTWRCKIQGIPGVPCQDLHQVQHQLRSMNQCRSWDGGMGPQELPSSCAIPYLFDRTPLTHALHRGSDQCGLWHRVAQSGVGAR